MALSIDAIIRVFQNIVDEWRLNKKSVEASKSAATQIKNIDRLNHVMNLWKAYEKSFASHYKDLFNDVATIIVIFYNNGDGTIKEGTNLSTIAYKLVEALIADKSATKENEKKVKINEIVKTAEASATATESTNPTQPSAQPAQSSTQPQASPVPTLGNCYSLFSAENKESSTTERGDEIRYETLGIVPQRNSSLAKK